MASGYGISGLSSLAKKAYLEAAQAMERDSGSKPNNARLAALTGLSRTEVLRLSRLASGEHQAQLPPVSRAQRVTLGWIADSNYCDNHGNPKVLTFSKGRTSFESLVKRYSGDIPARAMLTEMTRLGMALEQSNRSIRLIRADAPVRSRTRSSLGAISPWVKFLAESESELTDDLKTNTAQIRLSFKTLPQLFSAVRELQDRAEAFVCNVRELGHRSESKNAHKLHVSVALATRVLGLNELEVRRVARKRND